LSLPERLWEALNLDPHAARSRAEFFDGYASIEQLPFSVHEIIRLMRYGLPVDNRAVIDLLHPTGEAAIAVVRRLGEEGPAELPEPWVHVAEQADAWRESAMAKLLYDSVDGRSTLLRAASAYDQLGLPFGAFLTVAAGGSREPAWQALNKLDAVLGNRFQEADEQSNRGLIGPAAFNALSQHIALLFTAASDPWQIARRGESLEATLASVPQATGSAPVGTTAQPIALWWSAGRHLMTLIRGNTSARANLKTSLSDLAIAHGHQLKRAQLDEYHWMRALCRVDLVDLDLAGLVAISARVLLRTQSQRWSETEFAELPELAQISIVVGLQLAYGDDNPAENLPGPRPDKPRMPSSTDTDTSFKSGRTVV
jgi:hypothetical protein